MQANQLLGAIRIQLQEWGIPTKAGVVHQQGEGVIRREPLFHSPELVCANQVRREDLDSDAMLTMESFSQCVEALASTRYHHEIESVASQVFCEGGTDPR
jgi:hypothetical protein